MDFFQIRDIIYSELNEASKRVKLTDDNIDTLKFEYGWTASKSPYTEDTLELLDVLRGREVPDNYTRSEINIVRSRNIVRFTIETDEETDKGRPVRELDLNKVMKGFPRPSKVNEIDELDVTWFFELEDFSTGEEYVEIVDKWDKLARAAFKEIRAQDSSTF